VRQIRDGARAFAARWGSPRRVSATATVTVTAGEHRLTADLTVPDRPAGIVVFAHGSGSGRVSPRNRTVAQALWDADLATLLLDLLTPAEDAEDQRTRRLRFDVQLLGERVAKALDWLRTDPSLAALPAGCFGASTGAAAALIAAAARHAAVAAVVSRGGRPDLAGDALAAVRAPTLLIVGGEDREVLGLNRAAAQRMAVPPELAIVPGAGHLFSEPGALERVMELTTGWFATHLPGR
jgi:putative phosphoribosyl transferase